MNDYTAIKFMDTCSPEMQREIENQLRKMGGTPDLTRQDPENREYCWRVYHVDVFEAFYGLLEKGQLWCHNAHPPQTFFDQYKTAWDALAGASQISAQLNEDMAKKQKQRPNSVETLGRVIECADAAQQALSKVNGNDANPDNRGGLVKNGFGFYSGITSILLGQEETKGIINTPAILGLGDILEQTKPGNGKEESSEVQKVRKTAEAAYDTVLAFYHQKYPQQTQ